MTTKTDFFIVGAPKAGTTSLHDVLIQHPEIFLPELKEPNFFTADEIKQQNLYYNEKLVETPEEYQKLFSATQKKLKGEASVSYLFYPSTAKRIQNYNPEAKIIIILRHPVQRAISHYQMDHRLGLINSSLETVFRNKDKPEFKNYFQQYFLLGCYFNQVSRYFEAFPENQIKIYFFESLKSDFNLFITDVLNFLGATHSDFTFSESHSNPAFIFKYAFLQKLYQNPSIRKFFKLLLPSSILKKSGSALTKTQFTELSATFKQDLNTFYRTDIDNLEQLLEVSLEHWKK